MSGKTLYDKIWETHLIEHEEGGEDLIYIDRQLVHEVTSPQAFKSITLAGRKVRNPSYNLAVSDHNVPTDGSWKKGGIKDEMSRMQIQALEENTKEHNITCYSLGHINQGVVHVVGPELGFTQPGMTIVCGDSHTSTHGALGALAFGIGTSEVEHAFATQTLRMPKSKNFLITLHGKLSQYTQSKDLIMAIIGKIGTAGGTGHVIEYAGDAIKNLSIEGRMTICNMSIEAGARAGLIEVDQKTIDYITGKPLAPTGEELDRAIEHWKTLTSDSDANFDKSVEMNIDKLEPQITWGTSPEDVTGITGVVPSISDYTDETRRNSFKRSLEYMGLNDSQPLIGVKVDKIFIGSCTNSRIEDLRIAASIIKGKKISQSLKMAMVVPGSGLIKEQAEKEGLDKIFTEAGFEWREPGCSMCLAMNNDRLSPQERCISTSNRNFEGRQGRGGRTHLASPITAAASAISGHIEDPRAFDMQQI